MAETVFAPGNEVVTPRGRGTVIDVRPTPAGAWVFGVEDHTGEVTYYTGRALRIAQD